MSRKFAIGFNPALAIFLLSTPYLSIFPAYAQQRTNVVQFLDAIGRVCGGTSSQKLSTDSDNITFKDAEVTVDPGTGKLSVEKNGVIIAEQRGANSERYYICVKDLTATFGGQFSPLPNDKSRSEVRIERDVVEPSRDEMLQAHKDQVNSAALALFPIDHFEKLDCTKVEEQKFRCRYSIRSGGFGSQKSVANYFSKTSGRWVMSGD